MGDAGGAAGGWGGSTGMNSFYRQDVFSNVDATHIASTG